MRIISILLAVFLTLNTVLYAGQIKDKKQGISILPAQKELDADEILQYSLEWLGIPVGRMIMKTEGLENINGYSCYHISAQVLLNRLFRRFYNIEYKVHTYIDKKLLFTRRFEKIRRINDESNFVAIEFDQEQNKAVFVSKGSSTNIDISPLRDEIREKNPATAKIPYGTQDLLSFFYYFRLQDIKENHNYTENLYYDQRNWLVNMITEKPFSREIRKKGSFSVIGVIPDSELNNYILGKRKFIVYMTVDSRRLPLEFKLNTALGPIRAMLQNPPN